MVKLPELLAPAGSYESLVAAIGAGADAVYIGGPRFGARSYAENFDRSRLRDAISYAHLRDVPVYVTVNTLILDSEIRDATEFLLFLYECGADAVLIQDPGLAAIARELVPDLPLHASTQMTIYNCEGVAFAKKQGFRRVVLARELSFSEIKEIGTSPECQGIGLEIFVHGALCYSYSGQCLLSSVIGGRSGNRGMCAQPCRKPYTLLRGPADAYGRPVSLSPVRCGEEYLLSTRDLSLYPLLDKIVGLPVESLKIEGRMRSPRYVGTVVSIYRKALDAIGSGTWTPSRRDEQELALAFNRGFTEGYAGGAGARGVMGRERPNHRGLPAGTVTAYDPARRLALVTLSGPLVPDEGDGIVFRDPVTSRELGMVIPGPLERTDQGHIIPVKGKVPAGALLFITRRSDQHERSGPGFAGNEKEQPWIPVGISVTWDGDRRPVLSGHSNGKHGIRVSCEITGDPMAEALTRPLSRDQLRVQLGRTGGTPFSIRDMTIRYPGGLFAPVGVLNKLRRDFFSGLTEAILSSWQPSPENRKSARLRMSRVVSREGDFRAAKAETGFHTMQVAVYVSGYGEACAALEAGCDLIYFEPDPPDGTSGNWCRRGMNPEYLPPGLLKGLVSDVSRLSSRFPGKIIWKWPLITDKDFLNAALDALPGLVNKGLSGIMTESPGIADRVRNEFPDTGIFGGPGLNIFNHVSAEFYKPLFRRLTLSPELSCHDITTIVSRFPPGPAGPEFEVIVQGTPDVLVSRDCLPAGIFPSGPDCVAMINPGFQGIGDSTGRIFPLRTDWSCRTHIANCSETCFIDGVPPLGRAGITAVSIDARHRPPEYAGEMTEHYREAMRVSGRDDRDQDFSRLLQQIKHISLGGITAAHFRGSLCRPEPGE